MSAPMPAAAFVVGTGSLLPEAACAPHELEGVLDRYPGVTMLSLDCFDTLLWRDSHAPHDVFATLPDIAPPQRMAGETRARTLAKAARGVLDVSLDTIYGTIMPRADARARGAAIAAELAAETRHCHAFAPVVALMREARWRKIKIIIVSDTYFDQRQLRQLVRDAAGADVDALIDQVFCSSSFGRPKAGGLYQDVLARVKARPDQILHIGDNHKADVIGVHPFGVHTMHLVQFEPEVAKQLRMESTIATMLFGLGLSGLAQSGSDRLLTRPQPHRAALALGLPQESDPARRLGQGVLGPLFFGFDTWLRNEAAALAGTGLAAIGGQVHWLFMMRDGFLPMRVHHAIGPASGAHEVEISRLTATFASITDDRALTRLLGEQALTTAPALGRMLRLGDALIDRICGAQPPVAARAALEEWCGEGMPVRLANFASMRFGSALTFGDAADGGPTVPVVLVTPQGEVQGVCPARPTHDGFHALCIPLGRERHPVAVQIGAAGGYIEIETIDAVPTSEYLHTRPDVASRENAVVPILDGIVEYAPRLWQCQSTYAFALLQPPAMDGVDDLMLVMVFRALGQ